MISRVSVERSWEFQVAGAGFVVLAGLIGYGVYVFSSAARRGSPSEWLMC
jgi:hypothetical protein